MLTSFHLQNFKAWRDTGRVRLAPLTVIFGANSTGKSSLGHWMLALKQTAYSADRKRALHLGDDRSLVDLGTFRDCLHDHDTSLQLGFSLRWRLLTGLEIVDPLTQQMFRGREIGLDVSLAADAADQPQVRALRYHLFDGYDETLGVSLERTEQGQLSLNATGYRLVRVVGKPWPLDPPEKFYRIGESSLARFQNAGFLSDLALSFESMLGRFHYLGPLRDAPRRIYQWAGDAPESLGMRGEYAIAALLSAGAQGRCLSLGPRQKARPLPELIASLLKRLGMIESFQVRPVAEV